MQSIMGYNLDCLCPFLTDELGPPLTVWTWLP
jgi:hypothetical protein